MLKKNMGPMGPRGLGPWALWAPGTLGTNFEIFNIEQKLFQRTYFEPPDRFQMILEKSKEISKKIENIDSS